MDVVLDETDVAMDETHQEVENVATVKHNGPEMARDRGAPSTRGHSLVIVK